MGKAKDHAPLVARVQHLNDKKKAGPLAVSLYVARARGVS
jgi:hypothetical protein